MRFNANEKYPTDLFAELYHDRWPVDIFQPYCLHKFQVNIVNLLFAHGNDKSTAWADPYTQEAA